MLQFQLFTFKLNMNLCLKHKSNNKVFPSRLIDELDSSLIFNIIPPRQESPFKSQASKRSSSRSN